MEDKERKRKRHSDEDGSEAPGQDEVESNEETTADADPQARREEMGPPHARIQLRDVTPMDVICGRGFQPDSKCSPLQSLLCRTTLDSDASSSSSFDAVTKASKAIFACTKSRICIGINTLTAPKDRRGHSYGVSFNRFKPKGGDF